MGHRRWGGRRGWAMSIEFWTSVAVLMGFLCVYLSAQINSRWGSIFSVLVVVVLFLIVIYALKGDYSDKFFGRIFVVFLMGVSYKVWRAGSEPKSDKIKKKRDGANS